MPLKLIEIKDYLTDCKEYTNELQDPSYLFAKTMPQTLHKETRNIIQRKLLSTSIENPKLDKESPKQTKCELSNGEQRQCPTGDSPQIELFNEVRNRKLKHNCAKVFVADRRTASLNPC